MCVSVVSLSAPNDNTEESDNSLRSSPITASLATDKPPSVCKEPSVVDVASVVSSVLRIPLNVPVVADNVLAPTIVPLTSRLPLISMVLAVRSI